MRYADIDSKLVELRKEYGGASPARKIDIKVIANKIKTGQKCRQCDEVAYPEEPIFPFCSQECNDKWGGTNYPDTPEAGGKSLTKGQIKERIRKIIEKNKGKYNYLTYRK